VSVTISPAKADLVVTLTAPSSKNLGQSYTYVVTTKNMGPSTASKVFTFITLPIGVRLESATPGFKQVGNVLSWVTPSLAQDATTTHTATVKAASKGIKVAGAASISAETLDPKPGTNVAAAVTRIR
jgi:uncharacterized repeat protein (TIGR01451 family)